VCAGGRTDLPAEHHIDTFATNTPKPLENKPHFRAYTILSVYLTSILPHTPPTSIQIPHNRVSSPGMPSNFHLNLIPGSLDEIHFGLRKTTKLPSFPGLKKKRVEANRGERVKEKKVFPHLSLFGFATESQLSATVVVSCKEDGNSYFNIVSVKCTE